MLARFKPLAYVTRDGPVEILEAMGVLTLSVVLRRKKATKVATTNVVKRQIVGNAKNVNQSAPGY